MAAEQSAPSDAGSASSPLPDDSSSGKGSKKRSSSDVVEDADGPQKVIKRRAARACVSCRARKVRCDVVENSPCGNCRWDGVEVCLQNAFSPPPQRSWPACFVVPYSVPITSHAGANRIRSASCRRAAEGSKCAYVTRSYSDPVYLYYYYGVRSVTYSNSSH